MLHHGDELQIGKFRLVFFERTDALSDRRRRAYLSIGEVLGLLLEEFPDVTISKIRFLESQGLIEPERTPSGYRKFYDDDVELLRVILREQRENFLPLRVIKDRSTRGQIAIRPAMHIRRRRRLPAKPTSKSRSARPRVRPSPAAGGRGRHRSPPPRGPRSSIKAHPASGASPVTGPDAARPAGSPSRDVAAEAPQARVAAADPACCWNGASCARWPA